MEPLQGIFIVLIVIAVILAIFLIMALVAAARATSMINTVNRTIKNAGAKLQSLQPYAQGLPQLWEGVKSEIGRLSPQGQTFLQGVEGHIKNFVSTGTAKVAALM